MRKYCHKVNFTSRSAIKCLSTVHGRTVVEFSDNIIVVQNLKVGDFHSAIRLHCIHRMSIHCLDAGHHIFVKRISEAMDHITVSRSSALQVHETVSRFGSHHSC
ncbi:hypothetical protein TNCT_225441 [Trichonephila clavata]|uniref:Uncharacterized protein n=1 Tax=Trichonephila clavata TaxID=2740835 RepID=A0A8X6IV98_TRICU|nr:hypothetical protein TNCT_225441 [Trichonephila clavata]